MSFSDMMQMGHESMGKGRYRIAVIAFDTALHLTAGEPATRLQAYHSLGIAHRLSCEYWKAIEYFEEASSLAEDDDSSRARILRDWAMVYLDQATTTRDDLDRWRLLGDAEELLQASKIALQDLGETVEAAVSEGFMGRSFFIDGERAAALETLRSVQDKLFEKHPVYELNNLIWLARASFTERWRKLPYAARLIARTGHTRHWVEYAMLLVGGNTLYAALKGR